MAHVVGNHPLHSFVAMPPHAWSTQHQHSSPQNHRLSLPAYPSTSSSHSRHPWHPDPVLAPHPHQSSLTPDLTPHTNHTDQINADTIFRDLLNLRIASDNSPDTHSQHQLPLSSHLNHRMSAQVALSPSLVRKQLFPNPDPASDLIDIPDAFDHTEHSLEQFSSHLSSIPFLQHHHLHHQHQHPSLSESLSVPHRLPLAQHGPFTSSPLVNRRHSSHALYRTSATSDHSARASTPRSHISSIPSQTGPRIKNDLYKTEICRSFAENAGFCKYGSKCQFAHGEEELRPVRRHPRYKTKLCRNFVNNGSCPYDTRCRFIHANDLPFVSTTPISALHQPSVPSTHAHGTGEEYADHLRHILSMAPGSAVATGTTGNIRLPVSSPNASSSSDTDPTEPSLSKAHEKGSGQLLFGGQGLQKVTPVVPNDDVFHATVKAFRDFPDNAFSQPFVPLVSADPDRGLASVNPSHVGGTASVEALHKTTAIRGEELSNVFRSSELSASNTFTTGSQNLSVPNGRVVESPLQRDTPNLPESSGLVDSAPKPTVTKATRGRLPVFRNITSDADSA